MAFPNNCNPRVITVDASTGCTLTRASIRGMTPQDFEDQGPNEVGMDRIIQRAREARATGVVENTLETLLMSNLRSIKKAVKKAPIVNESVILPYIYMRQKRNINSNYWVVVGGNQTQGAGSNGLHPGAWDLTISNNPSPFASPLQNLERYFLPGKKLLVETMDTVTGVSHSLQYDIIRSVNAGSNAIVTVKPNISPAGWGALSPTEKAVYQPTDGNVIVLANDVSDYESWGYQDPAENTNKLLTFWLQTSREVHEYTDEYLKALNAALTSGYFKDFRQLPLAEQKRIQHMKYVRDWLNSVFYGREINEFQTPETYQQLPTVKDPNDPNCTLEYKANALGAKTQLEKCGRVYDHQGNALNLDLLAEVGYQLKRAREASGGSVDTIDIMTDRFTAGSIMSIMTKFYKAKYGVEISRHFQANQALTFENQVMLNYNIYQLPPELGGYNLAVFTHPYFDDKLAASSSNIRSRARTIWAIDWSDFTIGIAETNSKQRQTNEADELYQYRMKANVKHVMMNSIKWTTILEDPNRHYVIDNFSDECPKLTVAGCDLEDSDSE